MEKLKGNLPKVLYTSLIFSNYEQTKRGYKVTSEQKIIEILTAEIERFRDSVASLEEQLRRIRKKLCGKAP